MKKTIIIMMSVLLLTGCTKVREVVEHSSDVTVSTNSSLDNSYYPTISFSPNTGRNEYYNSFAGTSDFQKVGRELELLSTNHFSTSNHYMSDGQYLTYANISDDLIKWKTESRPYTLQLAQDDVVEDKTQIILTKTIYEVDFYQKNNDGYVLSGMSFGIVVEPKVRLESGVTTTPSVAFSDEFLQSYCEDIIEKFYTYTLESKSLSNYKDIPKMIAVYLNDDSSNNYSGGYTMKSYCDGSLGKIDYIDYDQVVFSSSYATSVDPVTSDEFSQFRMHIKNNSVEAVGAVGYGIYRDGSLENLNITVNCNVKTYVEIEYLVGIIAGYLKTSFTEVDTVTVKIESQIQLESIVVKEKNQEVKSYMVNY